MPFFSVIIPLYNKEHYIKNTLETVLQQTFEDFEIVIVNDGSTDNSVGIVERFSSEKIKLFHQDNLGASKARNNGATYAEGKYLAFLDADDKWTSNHLECLKESISAYPNAGLYANNYLIKHSKTFTAPAQLNIEFNTNAPVLLEDFFKASLKDTIVWTSATGMKKTVFQEFGMFNPIYLSSQDLDLWIRVALKKPVVFHPKVTMIYNKSIDNSLGKFEDNDARYTLFNSFSNYEKHNIYLKKYLDIKRYGLALRTKINGEFKIYKDTKKNIDFKNLSFKQKVLLNTPHFVLKILNTIRPLVIKNTLFLSLFKR